MKTSSSARVLLAATILGISFAASAQTIDEAVIIEPLADESLFVDPTLDTIDPARAYLRPADAEIELERLDVRTSENELPVALFDLNAGRLDPSPDVFLDPGSSKNELRNVTGVAARGANALLNRLARRASYNELAATRKIRFARTR